MRLRQNCLATKSLCYLEMYQADIFLIANQKREFQYLTRKPNGLWHN